MLDGCICALIPRIANKTRILLAIDEDEAKKPTNTGLLAARCLVNSEVVVIGAAGLVADVDENAAILADADDARDVRDVRPATLVVPDGTWRQARRIRRKLALPCVTLPPGAPTEYTLRSDAHEGGLATLEAIARALALVDGIDVEPMLVPFRAMIAHTLARRGQGWGKRATSDDDKARA